MVANDTIAVCETCGKPTEKIINWPTCPGTERMIVHVMCDCEVKQREQEEREREQYEKMRRIEKLRNLSLMDDLYRNARFSTYRNTPENEQARRCAGLYVEKFDVMRKNGEGLLFYGPVGTGKTYTAACIANELIDRGIAVVVTSFVKILQKIQGDSAAENKIMRIVDKVDLLIIDDLGTERNTDYALEKVYNIIDARTRTEKPMILTTNLMLGSIINATETKYQRIYDRIVERCYPVEIAGRSFRRESAATRFSRMEKTFEKNAAGGIA